MGVTSKSLEVIQSILTSDIKSVCDLGAQNDYTDMGHARIRDGKWPYISEWWKAQGISYMCIDLNGENEAEKWDLSEPLKTNEKFDLVCDLGTSEHVDNLYQCLKSVNALTKVGGLMYHENPKTGNWPGHGFHYRTMDFYTELAQKAGYTIIKLEEHPAMGNVTDGWNIIAVLRKEKEGFVSKEDFPQSQKS